LVAWNVVSRGETQLLSGLRLVCGDPVKPLLTKAVNSVDFLSHVSRPDANACGTGVLDVGWRESKRMSHMNSTQGQWFKCYLIAVWKFRFTVGK